MVRRHNRLLVALYVFSDALLAMWAFVLAYGIRFESGLMIYQFLLWLSQKNSHKAWDAK